MTAGVCVCGCVCVLPCMNGRLKWGQCQGLDGLLGPAVLHRESGQHV